MKTTTLKDRVIERLDEFETRGPFAGAKETERCAESIIAMVKSDIKEKQVKLQEKMIQGMKKG